MTFTRTVFKDKNGKVLTTTDWKAEDSTMSQVPSKLPNEVGYDKVDKKIVEKITVDPTSEKTDLGKTVVTYTINPTPEEPSEKTYNVTVHYVDEDGNVIKNPVKEEKNFKTGEGYDENSKKDSTIIHDGKTYEFVRVQEGDKPAGTIEDKDVDVTYVYKLKKDTPAIPEPSKDKYYTTVEYVTEDGKTLIPSVPGQSDLTDGSNFDNIQAKKETIIVNGKLYKLISESNVSNKIAGKNEVTKFIYKEVIPTQEDNKNDVEEPSNNNHSSIEDNHADNPTKEIVNNETEVANSSKHENQQTVVNSTRKLNSTSIPLEKQQVNAPKNVALVSKIHAQRTLPRTGEKRNSLAYVGIGVSMLAGLLGLAFTDRKKKRN